MYPHRILFWLLVFASGFRALAQKPAPPRPEVIYHVVQRSFYDSNGDGHGDFNGLKAKLDYLEDLGVNTILMLPIFESVYYHNYFSSGFEKIDPHFGTQEDWKNLVLEIHRRNMKIYMDLEFQYITEDHLWYKESVGKPGSAYSPYLIFNAPGNQGPESIIFGLTELTGYDGTKKKITTINLKSPEVAAYFSKLLLYWMDLNGDGNFSDGVDGFRLDHMMDKLDGKEKFAGLFSGFWNPILKTLKSRNPKLTLIAEQADWATYGQEYFTQGGVDRVFAFRLRNALISLNKDRIARTLDSTLLITPVGKQQVLFLENHDMNRVATEMKGNPEKLKALASLQLLLSGTPAIYYGQEIGMKGSGGFGKFGNTDGNDIPYREAFEWYASDSGSGMALWYKNTGPWWDQTNLKPNDGVSLEEQARDPKSLHSHYRSLLKLRNENPVLGQGQYSPIPNPSPDLFSFLKQSGNQVWVVAVNFSENPVATQIDLGGNQFFEAGKVTPRFGEGNAIIRHNQKMDVSVAPYGTVTFRIR